MMVRSARTIVAGMNEKNEPAKQDELDEQSKLNE